MGFRWMRFDASRWQDTGRNFLYYSRFIVPVAVGAVLITVLGVGWYTQPDRFVRGYQPGQPIPSGAVTPGTAFAVAALLVIGGFLLLWLVQHAPLPWVAGLVLAAIVFACALPLIRLEEPPRALGDASVRGCARDAWRELVGVLRARAGRIALILAILPIGTGAAEFLFSAIGPEFHASADVVSAVLGLGGGLAIIVGCFAGGRLADRVSKPAAYTIACGLGLVACVVIALSPRTSTGYAASTLFYTFTLGMVTASFTGLVLAIIGDTAAATKINLFFALNTLFSLGMLRVAGWSHDVWSTNGMLLVEAFTGAAALALFAVLVRRVRGDRETGNVTDSWRREARRTSIREQPLNPAIRPLPQTSDQFRPPEGWCGGPSIAEAT